MALVSMVGWSLFSSSPRELTELLQPATKSVNPESTVKVAQLCLGLIDPYVCEPESLTTYDLLFKKRITIKVNL